MIYIDIFPKYNKLRAVWPYLENSMYIIIFNGDFITNDNSGLYDIIWKTVYTTILTNVLVYIVWHWTNHM